MKIALVRHGDAPYKKIDSQRQLSRQGQFEAHQTALYLKEIQFVPDKIIHSGLDRARDTAEIIREELNFNSPCDKAPELTPESNPDIWEHNLMGWPREENLLIISHMPFLPILLEQLTGKRTAFPTAGCVILERQTDDIHWQLIQANF